MINLVLYPHENAAELGDDMETLYGLLGQAGVFDGDTGGQIHTIVIRTLRELRGLADELDPAHVSIVPVPRPGQPANGPAAARNGRATNISEDVRQDILSAC